MAEEQQSQEKTEEPTEKRINDARDKGQVPRSREFTTVIVLMASALAMMMMGSQIMASISTVMEQSFQFGRHQLFDPMAMIHRTIDAIEILAFDLGLFFLITVLAALLAPACIGGWNFSTQAIAPKSERIDPLKGLKRIFGVQGLIELVKALAKFLLVSSISFVILWNLRDQLLALGQQDLAIALVLLGDIVLWVFLAVSSSLILIALIDVPFQHWNHHRQLKMTRQDLKDENKDTEGNPEVKGRVRKLQFELSQQRMMQAVPDADVIITNPTHYAVALKYDQSSNGAPFVIAKGTDLIAQQIKLIANHHDITVISAPPLTRAIYFSTELGDEIPSGLYIAVAQVLAFVFQLRRYHKQGGNKPELDTETLPIPDEFKRE